MKKLATLMTAVALLFVTSAGQAKDLGGKFGIGYEATLGGVQGLSLSYFVSQALAIDVLLGMSYISQSPEDTSPFFFDAALGVRYNFARAKDVNLGIGLRVDLGFRSEDAGDTFQANIELPLIVEYFFSEHFAINLQTGITIEIIPEDGRALAAMGDRTASPGNAGLANAEDFGLHFFNGGLFGSAGFKFYF